MASSPSTASSGIVVPYVEFGRTLTVRCALRPSLARRICQVPPESAVIWDAGFCATATAAPAPADAACEDGVPGPFGVTGIDTSVTAASGPTTTTERASA